MIAEIRDTSAEHSTNPATVPDEWRWHLHDTITRNHGCRTLDVLLAQAYDWIETNHNHYVEMTRCFGTAA